MIFEFNHGESQKINCTDMKHFLKIISKDKNKIDNYLKEWSSIKKVIHEYEYVYSSSNIKKNVSSILPISRSYFKLTEIINKHNLFNLKDKIKCFSMAEAPGGFIESLLDNKDKINKIYGITLLSEDSRVPFWNRKIKNNKLIELIYGSNNNGDLIDINNLLSLVKYFRNNKIHLITADGGFDCTNDYNNQEKYSLPLIYGEIFLALNVQSKNGVFICKIFDLFLKETIKLIYILILSYDKVYIHKPSISRISNSEKYLVCIGFKGYNKDIINILIRSFNNYDIDIQIDENFKKQMEAFNKQYTEKQSKQINLGIELIQKNLIKHKTTDNQINNSIQWCKENNIPINDSCYFLNRTSSN